MSTLSFIEKVGNPEEPGGSAHSMREQSAEGYYLLSEGADGALQPQDLLDAITQIVGTVNYNVGSGGLRRTQPSKHPLYNLYASKILRIWGQGGFTATNALPTPLYAIPSFAQFALYKRYWIQTQFTELPYVPLPDSMIIKNQGAGPIARGQGAYFYPEYGAAGGTTPYYYNFYPEWARYCDIKKIPCPSNDLNLTQQSGNYGQMIWVAHSGGGDKVPTGPFAGVFQLQLPNSLVRIKAFQIPARYGGSPNSFLDLYRNTVNANPINLGKLYCNPGELLYLDWIPDYTSGANPQMVNWSNQAPFNTWQGPAPLMDVELLFLYTRRFLPEGVTVTDPPTNLNYIVGGHNLLPCFKDRGHYYYACNAVDFPLGVPSFLARPLELLLTDPDAPFSQPTP